MSVREKTHTDYTKGWDGPIVFPFQDNVDPNQMEFAHFRHFVLENIPSGDDITSKNVVHFLSYTNSALQARLLPVTASQT